MKVAVVGAEGRLGTALVRLGAEPVSTDISNPKQVEHLDLKGYDVLICAAAYTDVDGAETDRDKAMEVNTRGPGLLRQAFGGFFIHLSTAYVFDGKAGPYTEEDVPNPINFYGMTKLGGEAAANVRQPTLIVRTLDLYSEGPHADYVRRLRDSLTLGRKVQAPSNLIGCPTYVGHLAEALMWLCDSWPSKWSQAKILNITGDANISRYAWAVMVAKHFGLDDSLIEATEEAWGQAPRPLRGGLLLDKARSMGVPLYGLSEGLKTLQEAERERDT